MGRPVAEISAELEFLSDRISSQVRSLGFGMIALVWALLTGLKDTSLVIGAGQRRELLGIALLAVLAMVIDFLQYLLGYRDTIRILRGAEKNKQKEAAYDATSALYRARSTCFWLKQVVVLLGVSWTICFLVRQLRV